MRKTILLLVAGTLAQAFCSDQPSRISYPSRRLAVAEAEVCGFLFRRKASPEQIHAEFDFRSPESAAADPESLPRLLEDDLETYLASLHPVSAEEEGVVLAAGSDLNSEHWVYHDLNLGMAIKVTKPETVEKVGGVAQYLERLKKGNELFGNGNKVIGWVELSGKGRQLVTAQPWFHGRAATKQEIDRYMKGLGFEKVFDGLYGRGSRHFWVGDVVPKNVRVDFEERVHVVDFTLPTVSERQADRYDEMMDTAARRDAQP